MPSRGRPTILDSYRLGVPSDLIGMSILCLTPLQSTAVFTGPVWEFLFAHGIRYTDASGVRYWTRFNYRYEAQHDAQNPAASRFGEESKGPPPAIRDGLQVLPISLFLLIRPARRALAATIHKVIIGSGSSLENGAATVDRSERRNNRANDARNDQ
jgi:hypothetical protein